MPHRSVADNVATIPVLMGVKRSQARRDALEILERVGLEPSLGSRYPNQLSGGQRQRVGVARALAGNPHILLMDEPFAAVDPIVRRELQDELLGLQSELGKTIVFVTHDIDEAFRLGDTVLVLQEGARIAQRGTPAEILADPHGDFVADFIGASRGQRTLTTILVHGRTIAIDGDGRPVGVLSS